MQTLPIYILIFLYGLLIGSFLNVVIYRVPEKQNIVTTRSHCMSCGYELKWYDLVPLFSYLALGGKCRKCKERISVQYPLIEVLNGALYVVVFAKWGLSVDSLLYCLLFSALIAISVIDFRTYEIPLGINGCILLLGVLQVVFHFALWKDYLIGFLAVSLPLYLLFQITKGRGIGGGDVKLMAVCGLVIGWQNIILAFFLGCIIGSIVHVLRMRFSGAENVLAMGPYLSLGVMIAALYGQDMIAWYFGYLGF